MPLRYQTERSSKETSGPGTTPHSSNSENKISFLRILLLISLSLTGFCTGGLCYDFIRKYQTLFVEEHFEAMVNDHFKSTEKSFAIQLRANVALATTIALVCPTTSDWPNCDAPSRDVISRTASFSAMSGVLLFTLSPIVRPEDRQSFEEFAAHYYATDGGYSNSSGYTDLGTEIYHVDGISRVRAPNHSDPSTHRHDILVPLLYTSVPSYDYFLADTYEDPTIRPTLDEVLDCVNSTSPGNHHACSAITTLIPTDDYLAIASPIMPVDDPTTVVGFSGALISWQALFSTAVQHDFDFQCSIQSDASPIVRSFTINGGVAHATAGITHFPPSYDGYWKQSKLSFVLKPGNILTKDTIYTVTYYSSSDSPSPIFAVAAGLSCLGITLIISMIFVFFNTLIARAALEASMLLDSKRTFVRFVSHEIRCPALPSLSAQSHLSPLPSQNSSQHYQSEHSSPS
jgi:hypothetical protein